MILEPNDYAALTVTASSVIVNGGGILYNTVLTPGSVSCAVSLYDPAKQGAMTTVGARLIVSLAAPANSPSIIIGGDACGVRFLNGLIAVVTGTDAQAFTMHKHLF